MEGFVCFYSPEEKTLLCTIPFRNGLTVAAATAEACKVIDAGFNPKCMMIRDMKTMQPVKDIQPGGAYYLTTSKQDFDASCLETYLVIGFECKLIEVKCLPDQLYQSLCDLYNRNDFTVKEIEGGMYQMVRNPFGDNRLPVATLLFPNGHEKAALVNAADGTEARVFLERISWSLPQSFPFNEYELDREMVFPGDVCKLIKKEQ